MVSLIFLTVWMCAKIYANTMQQRIIEEVTQWMLKFILLAEKVPAKPLSRPIHALTQPVPHALTVSVSRMCFATSLESYASEQGALNTAKCECESVLAQCWQMRFYNTGMVVLCISGDPSGEGSCLDIQFGKDGEQDRACSVAQFSACMYISGASSAVHTCSKKCFTENSFLPEEA